MYYGGRLLQECSGRHLSPVSPSPDTLRSEGTQPRRSAVPGRLRSAGRSGAGCTAASARARGRHRARAEPPSTVEAWPVLPGGDRAAAPGELGHVGAGQGADRSADSQRGSTRRPPGRPGREGHEPRAGWPARLIENPRRDGGADEPHACGGCSRCESFYFNRPFRNGMTTRFGKPRAHIA